MFQLPTLILRKAATLLSLLDPLDPPNPLCLERHDLRLPSLPRDYPTLTQAMPISQKTPTNANRKQQAQNRQNRKRKIKDDFHSVIEDSWNNDGISTSNSMILLKNKLKFLKQRLKEWSSIKRRNKDHDRKVIQDSLVEIDLRLDKGNGLRDDLTKRANLFKGNGLPDDLTKRGHPRVLDLRERIALVSESTEGLNTRLENWREALEDNGLRVNREKTDYLRCDFGNVEIDHNEEVDICIGDMILQSKEAELEVETIINKMMEGRLRWFGHVKRKPHSTPVTRVEALVVEGLRRRGIPKLRWDGRVKHDMKKLHLSEEIGTIGELELD
nr:cytochrome P450 [Tanacetum cinerariifolium]